MLCLDRSGGTIYDAEGRRFDPIGRNWQAANDIPHGESVTVLQAVDWLQKESRHRLRTPVGVIGPRDATPEQLQAALEVGRGLARVGLTIVCGGRQGIMEAACQGAAELGGLSIGLLPETDPAHANAFVTVPIATGIGEARNALIARSALCLISIGDSYGTLSEVALGLLFGKPLFGLAGAAKIAGIRHCINADAAVECVALIVLGLPL